MHHLRGGVCLSPEKFVALGESVASLQMKNKGKGIGKRRTGGGRTKGKLNKAVARTGFECRHIDQVLPFGTCSAVIDDCQLAILHCHNERA